MDILLSTDGSTNATSQLLAAGQANQVLEPPSATNQSSLESFISTQSTSTITAAPKIPPKGQTMHLYTPASMACTTPCILHPTFLPSHLAKALRQELQQESITLPPPGKFNPLSRTVQSPYRSVMYEYTTTPATTPYYYPGITLPPHVHLPPQCRLWRGWSRSTSSRWSPGGGSLPLW